MGPRRPPLRPPLAAAGLALAGLALAGCGTGAGPSTVRADGFTVHFAWHATEGVTTERVQGRQVRIDTWAASKGDETDAVSSSAPDGVGSGPGALALRLREAVDGSAAALGGTVLSHRTIHWQGRTAEAAVIATPDRLVRERALVAGGHLDVVEGFSRAARPGFAGYDRLLATFRLTGPGA